MEKLYLGSFPFKVKMKTFFFLIEHADNDDDGQVNASPLMFPKPLAAPFKKMGH